LWEADRQQQQTADWAVQQPPSQQQQRQQHNAEGKLRRRKGTASKQRQLPAAENAPQYKLAQRMLARLAAKQQWKAELLFA
jgi:hypothetical protein